MTSSVLSPGGVAVITGAASGIGQAAAAHCAKAGMKVCLADLRLEALERARAEILAQTPKAELMLAPTDVADIDAVATLKDRVYAAYDRVDFLMNNAAVQNIGRPWSDYDAWKRVLSVNLWGVLNGVQVFTEAMIAQGGPAAIINVGSKQGITTPPGNAAYNVSKAGVKALTEQLAYELRQIEGCQVTAHLLVPGYTFTRINFPEMTAETPKPAAAWRPDQVIDFMVQRLAAGDFYMICPDNDVTPELDKKRIAWAAGDLIENRPALSRWHPDYQDAFAAFVK